MEVSFDKIDGIIWYDGRLVPWADANVHLLTHGLHYASCVFEGERAYGGRVFRSTAHSERLKNSANILDFEIPYLVAEIDAAKQLVIEANNGRSDRELVSIFEQLVARKTTAPSPSAPGTNGKFASS